MAVLICLVGVANLNLFEPHRNRILFWLTQLSFLVTATKYVSTLMLQLDDLEQINLLQRQQQMGAKHGGTGPSAESEAIGILLMALDLTMYLSSILAILLAIYVMQQKFKTQRHKALEQERIEENDSTDGGESGHEDVGGSGGRSNGDRSAGGRKTTIQPRPAAVAVVPSGDIGDFSEDSDSVTARAPANALRRQDTIAALFDNHAAHEAGLKRTHSQRQKQQKRNTQMRLRARSRIKSTKALHKVPIFSKLDDETIGTLVDAMQYRKFPRGTVLCKQGDLAREFFIVVSGECAVTVERSRLRNNKTLRSPSASAAAAAAAAAEAGAAAAAAESAETKADVAGKDGDAGSNSPPSPKLLKPPNLGFKWVAQVSKAKKQAMLALEPVRVATIKPLGFFGEAALLKSVAGREGGLSALSVLRSATVTVDSEWAQVLSLRSDQFLRLLENDVIDNQIVNDIRAINKSRLDENSRRAAAKKALRDAARRKGVEVSEQEEEEWDNLSLTEADELLASMAGIEDLQNMLSGFVQSKFEPQADAQQEDTPPLPPPPPPTPVITAEQKNLVDEYKRRLRPSAVRPEIVAAAAAEPAEQEKEEHGNQDEEEEAAGAHKMAPPSDKPPSTAVAL